MSDFPDVGVRLSDKLNEFVDFVELFGSFALQFRESVIVARGVLYNMDTLSLAGGGELLAGHGWLCVGDTAASAVHGSNTGSETCEPWMVW